MTEDCKNEVPAINRCLGTIFKTMKKLEKLGVLSNFNYCLHTSGVMHTHGWPSMQDIVMKSLREQDTDTLNKVVQSDLNDKDITNKEPKVFLGKLPSGLDASRDCLRPLLVEMVRVWQSKGMYIPYLYYLILKPTHNLRVCI